MKRKLLALFLAGLLCLGLTAPGFASVEELVSLRVDDVTAYSPEEGIYTVRENGLYGYYHTDGTLLLEPNYAAAGEFHDGMAAVSLAGERVRVRENRQLVERFQNGRFGYVDTQGILMISMQYERAYPFSEGRAFAVRPGGELVLLDRNGEELAAFPDAALPEDGVLRFSEGRAVIPVKGGEEQPETVYLVVDASGQEVCTLADAAVDWEGGYHDGLLAVAEAGEWTLNDKGEPLEYLPVPGSWGYRDRDGEIAVAGQFEQAKAFTGGLAAVYGGGEASSGWGLIDSEGKQVVPARYDSVILYEDGTAALLLDGKWAYVDRDGSRMTGFDYDRVGQFQDGIAFVRSGNEMEAIDTSGEVLFTCPGVVRAWDFSGGVAVLEQADGTFGVCGRDGSLLVPFSYESAFHWDGYLWLKRGDLWRVYDTAEVIDRRSAAPEEDVADVGGFADVPPDSWYADAVIWATDHDVITGTGGGLFSPDRPCTVGEILTFFWRAAGRPEVNEEENPFVDVSPNNYYFQAALWAYENGMTDGEVFGAAELCSRAMAVSYMWHIAGCPMDGTAAFADVSEDAAYAPAVAWAVADGITAGSGDGLFSPDAICSRGQIVTFLYRFLVGEN